jgi:hypothetical protein
LPSSSHPLIAAFAKNHYPVIYPKDHYEYALGIFPLQSLLFSGQKAFLTKGRSHMTHNLWKKTGICLLLAFLCYEDPSFSQSTEPESSPQESTSQNHIDLKIEDLPQPVPKMLDTLKRIGNDVGNEISKATGKAAEAVNKAVRTEKPSNTKTESSGE